MKKLWWKYIFFCSEIIFSALVSEITNISLRKIAFLFNQLSLSINISLQSIITTQSVPSLPLDVEASCYISITRLIIVCDLDIRLLSSLLRPHSRQCRENERWNLFYSICRRISIYRPRWLWFNVKQANWIFLFPPTDSSQVIGVRVPWRAVKASETESMSVKSFWSSRKLLRRLMTTSVTCRGPQTTMSDALWSRAHTLTAATTTHIAVAIEIDITTIR